jgi:hypothetical protein
MKLFTSTGSFSVLLQSLHEQITSVCNSSGGLQEYVDIAWFKCTHVFFMVVLVSTLGQSVWYLLLSR